MRTILTCCLVWACLCSAFSACSPEKDTQATADEAESYASFRAQHADVVEAMPRHADSKRILDRLAELFAAEAPTAADASRLALMYHEADSNVGLALFDEQLDQARREGNEDVFVAEVIKQAGASSVGAAALHADLQRRRSTEGEAFFAHTCALLKEEQDPRRRRVVRMQRAEYLSGQGQFTPAALEWLALCGEQPSEMKRPHLRTGLAGALRQAGFLLEADVVETSAVPDAVLASLPVLFARFHEDDDTAPRLPQQPDALSLYVTATPDLEHLTTAAGLVDAPPAERLMLVARTLRLCGPVVDRELLLGLIRDMAQLHVANAGHEPSSVDPLVLWSCHLAVRHAFVLLGEGGLEPNPVTARDRFKINDNLAAETLLMGFSGGHLDMSRHYALTHSDGVDLYAEALRWHVALLMPRQQRQAICDAYEQFLADVPDANQAPATALALAAFYETNLNLPQKAIATYRHLIEHYGGSSQAGEGTMRLGLLLYEQQAHEEAYLVFQEMTETASDERLVAALFMVALCESAMGLTDESEAHMAALVHDHHKSPHAARGLFWLASCQLARQEYGRAAGFLEDLLQRYPESPHTEQATQLLQRIEALQGSA